MSKSEALHFISGVRSCLITLHLGYMTSSDWRPVS